MVPATTCRVKEWDPQCAPMDPTGPNEPEYEPTGYQIGPNGPGPGPEPRENYGRLKDVPKNLFNICICIYVDAVSESLSLSVHTHAHIWTVKNKNPITRFTSALPSCYCDSCAQGGIRQLSLSSNVLPNF